MTTISKLLAASALAASFALPAFADENALLAERNVFTNSQQGWAQSYAMAKSVTQMSKHSHAGRVWGKDLSIASQK